MKQLLLLRHAHAETPRAGVADVDRPLSERGRAEALDAAQCVSAAGIVIEAVLASPAARARETAALLATQLAIAGRLDIDPALYAGSPDELLAPVRRCPDELRIVLVVGHNPGLSELAQRFKRTAPAIELRTSGLCAIGFEAQMHWSELCSQLATGISVLR
ncbi:MAG TPA: histidine phosphatase family protein [Steroidobacteraceae bacterium]